MLTDLL